MIGRFLAGAGLGALVGSGLLAVVSIVMPAPQGGRHPAAGLDSEDLDKAGNPLPEVKSTDEAEAPVASVTEVTPEVGPKAEAEPQPQPQPTLPVAEAPAPPTSGDTADAAPEDGASEAEPSPDAMAEAPSALAPAAEGEEGPQTPVAADAPLIGVLPSVPPALSGDAIPAPNETPAKAPSVAAPAPDAPASPQPVETDLAAPKAQAETTPPLDSPVPPEAPSAETAPPLAEASGLPPLTPEEKAMLAKIAKDGPGSALPQIEAEVAPAGEPLSPPEEAGQPAPSLIPEGGDENTNAGASTLPATPALAGSGEGVTTDRLPRIGAEATEPAEPATDTRPIAAYASKFDNPEAKPAFAIVLIDEGAAETDRAALAALPFPVSFALDPSDPKTPEYAAVYRAAGREVVMLASALPKGGQAGDIEVAMAAMSDVLPEAVAVMDMPARLFQANRPMATLVVPVIGADGRGLLTWDEGLNAADQVARREDIPAAMVFRDLDGEAESAPVIRRYLDRAAFKATQEGRVTVVGRTRPETVAALLEWAIEGRAATVALSPLTAVLKVD